MTRNGKKRSLGLVQVYTGPGKGKTTAALGLSLRAVGAGQTVFIAQFVKGMDYSELHSIKLLGPGVSLKQYGRGCFIQGQPGPEDFEAARAGLEEVKALVAGGGYDLVVLDEANIAVHFGLISVDDLLELIEARPAHVELVITGRNAHPLLIDRADLVTEMREIKHYYTQGVEARVGIEK